MRAVLATVEWSSVALLMTSAAALLTVPATFLRGRTSDEVNAKAAAAAKDAAERAAGIDAMRETMAALQADNAGYRDELRQQRSEHRAEMAAMQDDYRGRIRTLSTEVHQATAKATSAMAQAAAAVQRAEACEHERDGLRTQVAMLLRGQGGA